MENYEAIKCEKVLVRKENYYENKFSCEEEKFQENKETKKRFR